MQDRFWKDPTINPELQRISPPQEVENEAAPRVAQSNLG